MKKLIYIAIPLIVLFVFSACEDVVDIEVPTSEPRLVVEGNILDQPAPQEVRLTYSSEYFSQGAAPAVTGATLVLTRGDGVIDTLVERETEPGTYETQQDGVLGEIYVLDILTPLGKHFRSLPEELLPVTPIDELSYRFEEPDTEEDDTLYVVMIDAIEPPNTRNYYQWKVYVNGELQDEPGDLSYARDDFVQDRVDDVEIFFSSDIQNGDTIRVEQYSISETYYEFLNELFTQTAFIGGIFDPPPAPIKGNIYNVDDPNDYALGFFHASSIRDAETIVTE